MPETLATIFNTITLVLLGVLGALEVSKKKSHRLMKKILWCALVVSVCFGLALQFSVSLHQHTYKSDLVLRFEDKFEDKLAMERAQAARAINEYLQTTNWNSITNEEEIDGLENVLAFFDELGFYWKNGEISGAVLHEHFYSDMRTYCQESFGYIRKEQKEESSADWEYVEPLFNELTRIEAQRTGKNITDCVWDKQALQEYLKSEMRLQKK